MAFETAHAIWLQDNPCRDEYAVFVKKFEYTGGQVLLRVAAETDAITYINGARVDFCLFAGYRHKKFYDEADISSFCVLGENELRITVRYEGVDSATHIDDGAFVIFELLGDGQVFAVSDGATQGAFDPWYVQHTARSITGQLGLSSGMRTPTEMPSFTSCREIEIHTTFFPRPVKPLTLLPEVIAKPLKIDGHRIFDLGREYAGYVCLRVACLSAGLIKVVYGEHLEDGCVRAMIGGRDFSLDFICQPGKNDFLQLFVRVAGRYLEILTDIAVETLEIGLYPAEYPMTRKPRPALPSARDAEIYETCVRTLTLCMHTHYEDCPWREQALYVLDSRNQMLCGYDAFAETDFARANLVFISEGVREDGFLELTYPAVHTPAIPFFSVMYPVAVWEYVTHTGDDSILSEVMPTMLGIMHALKQQKRESGLIANLPAPFWNFYEWSTGSEGAGELRSTAERPEKFDLILNCAYVYALERMTDLCQKMNISFDNDSRSVKEAIQKTFWNAESGAYCSSTIDGRVTVLGNAFAMLIGLGNTRTLNVVRGKTEAVPATLSMMGYVYDALLSHGADPEEILNNIRENYGKMLDAGATSFWETIVGAADFGGAGSLCHGWSAMPIHFYHRLMNKKTGNY